MKRHDLHWNAWMGVTNERKGMNRWKDEMKLNDMKRNEMKWTTRTQTFEALKLFNESLYFRFQLYSDAEQDMGPKRGSHSFSFYVVDSWQINSGGSGRKCRQIQVPQALSHCLNAADSKPMIRTVEQLTGHLIFDIVCTTHTRTAERNITVYLCIYQWRIIRIFPTKTDQFQMIWYIFYGWFSNFLP